MAIQRLLRFAACEHREVIDANKRATAVALPLPSVLALQWHAIEAACGETARWSDPAMVS